MRPAVCASFKQEEWDGGTMRRRPMEGLNGWFTQKLKFCHFIVYICCSKPVCVSFSCWTQKKIF